MNYRGTGEGIYWDAAGWLYIPDGPRLVRFNPLTREESVVFDIGATHSGCDLWQSHSSDDGQVHSATVMDHINVHDNGAYRKVGTIVKRPGGVEYFAAQGDLDESQVDTSGRYLLIKEEFVRDKKRLDNRIIDFVTGTDVWLRDEDGALGHSDMGEGFAVGENDQTGTCDHLDLQTRQRRPLFATNNMGYVSVRGGRCLHSSETHLNLVDLHTGAFTPLLAHGGGSAYDDRVKANLDPTGRVACYLAHGVVYLLVLP